MVRGTMLRVQPGKISDLQRKGESERGGEYISGRREMNERWPGDRVDTMENLEEYTIINGRTTVT